MDEHGVRVVLDAQAVGRVRLLVESAAGPSFQQIDASPCQRVEACRRSV